jgi:hypothetical protein
MTALSEIIIIDQTMLLQEPLRQETPVLSTARTLPSRHARHVPGETTTNDNHNITTPDVTSIDAYQYTPLKALSHLLKGPEGFDTIL